MKVYGGSLFKIGEQWRAVVAANSQTQVAQVTGESLYYIRGWWTQTGNKEELEKALADPLKVIWIHKL